MHEHDPYNEPGLLKKVAEGSETAFRRLFDAYRSKVYTYVYRVTGSREVTEDIVQDVFLQVWISRKKLADVSNLNAYLHKAAHHAAYRSLEKVAKEELVLYVLKTEANNQGSKQGGSGEGMPATDPTRQLLSKEIRQQINNLVDRLTPRQREVFLLSRERGLKREEIARILDIGDESVKTHLAEALKFLRSGLKDQYGAGAVAIFVIWQLGNI